MLLKPLVILLLALPLAQAHVRQSDELMLPEDLSETEARLIRKERNPKSHVDATLKVSNQRINNAFQMVNESKYQTAARDVDVYAALISYADDYTRRFPVNKRKDRNRCLKKIEQEIFKSTRTMDAVVRGLPLSYRETTERAIDDVKKIRLRAINDLLGGGKIIDSEN